jgi:hypothetical protein
MQKHSLPTDPFPFPQSTQWQQSHHYTAGSPPASWSAARGQDSTLLAEAPASSSRWHPGLWPAGRISSPTTSRPGKKQQRLPWKPPVHKNQVMTRRRLLSHSPDSPDARAHTHTAPEPLGPSTQPRCARPWARRAPEIPGRRGVPGSLAHQLLTPSPHQHLQP